MSPGGIRHHLGDVDGALQDVNQAICLNPSLASAYVHRGRLYVEQRNYQAAIADFDKALDLHPKGTQILNERSVLRLRLKDMDGALADVNQALSLQPQFVEAYINRSIIRFERGDRSGACHDIDQVMTLNRQQGSSPSTGQLPDRSIRFVRLTGCFSILGFRGLVVVVPHLKRLQIEGRILGL